jgi:hypothetical protein
LALPRTRDRSFDYGAEPPSLRMTYRGVAARGGGHIEEMIQRSFAPHAPRAM